CCVRTDRGQAREPLPQIVDSDDGLAATFGRYEIAALDRLVERSPTDTGCGTGLGNGQSKLFHVCPAILAGWTPAVRPAFVRAMANESKQNQKFCATFRAISSTSRARYLQSNAVECRSDCWPRLASANQPSHEAMIDA